MTCEVCFTDSFDPVPQGTPDAIRDPNHEEKWVRCGYCFEHAEVVRSKAELAALKASIAAIHYHVNHGDVKDDIGRQAMMQAISEECEHALPALVKPLQIVTL